MHINAHGVNMEVSSELRRYAESRLWMLAHRSPRRVGWAGALLERDDASRRVTCRADAWVREFGLVSGRGADPDPFGAVDLAAHHLEQAIARHARRADRLVLPGNQRRNDAGLPPAADERPPHVRWARRDVADRGRGTHRVRADGCPFLDYDPVGPPDWPA